MKWLWDLGNGATSTLQNPSTTYVTPGTYTVSLTVTNAAGASHTTTKKAYLTVYIEPEADFTADKTTGCFPAIIQFTDLSSSSTGTTINEWKWDFGDGNTSNQKNPKHTYKNPGMYTVILTVNTDKGCKKVVVKPNYITIAQGVVPAFKYSDPTVCRAPITISFTNNSTGPGNLSYSWSFGDGGSSTTNSPNHSYGANGNYHVTLIVSSDQGCVDSSSADLSIGKVNTDFIVPPTICPKTLITFQNNSSPRPISSSWSFSNGQTDNFQNAQTIFSAGGSYTATLINTYAVCTDTLTKNITVRNAPVINFKASDTTKCQPILTTNFTNNTNASTYLWNFGDGSTSTQTSPNHSYNNFGTYNVTLIAKDTAGCSDTLTKQAYIKIAKPTINFAGLPAKGCIPATINFSANINSLDSVRTYLWDFGDGTTSNAATPSHIYNTMGTYAVKLTITTSSGCTETQTMAGGVRVGTLPTAAFTSDLTTACANPGIKFINQSVNATEFLWEFSDGTTSTAKDPQHTFTDIGLISVTLTAINNGCEIKTTKSDYVNILPSVSRFDYAPNCSNRLQYTFTDKSIQATSWNWSFGDGTTYSGQNPPVHNFPADGSYNVSLTTTNGSCTYTLTRIVTIADNTPNFNTSPAEGCKPFNTTVTATPPNGGLIRNYEWDFGDGSPAETSTGATTSHVFSTPGNFLIKLTTIDSFGCRHEFSKTAVKVNGPVADFTSTTNSGCKGMVTTFNDVSKTDGTNPIVSWKFDFGDGTSKTYNNPPFQHQYDSIADYDVKLVVTDAKGCKDSITYRGFIKVSTLKAGWSFANATCPNSAIGFSSSSQTKSDLPYTAIWDFGDGTTANTQDALHAYTDTGYYTLTLRVTDLLGCTDSLKKIDTIRVAVPKAEFTANNFTTYCTPFEAAFTNQSYFYNSSFWDLSINTSAQTHPSLYYTRSGTYPIKLVITSPGGCQDTITKTLNVFDPNDGRINYSPLNGCTPLLVNFDAFSQMIGRFIWDFGDGNVIDTTINRISHRYIDFGDFVPRVILKEPSGICVVPLTGLNPINISGVKAKYSLDKMLFCDSGQIKVSDSTTFNDPIRNYEWDFGDGTTYSIPSPVHYYTTPGTYTVSLVVNTEIGCTDTLKTGPVKVVQSPVIDISPSDTVICQNDYVTYKGLDLRPDTSAVNWKWSLNGKGFSVQNPPIQQFTTAGNYTISLVTVNSSGCVDSSSKNLVVHPLPEITVPASLTKIVGIPLTLPATYSNNIASYLWRPSGTLSCSDCPQPIATPKFTTNYNILVIDSNGCKNNTVVNVIVTCQGADIFVPNTFSPNGDGSNDVLYIRGKGLDRVKSLRIFNRWGQVVFEQQNFPVNNAMNGWDGKYKGSQPVPDVYVYQIELFCENSEIIRFEGNVALIL